MAIPTYEEFMLPLLSAIADGQVHQMRDFYLRLARSFHLTDEEIAERLPSGQQRIVDNRIGWARSYLKAAGLLDSPKRGFVTITDRGRAVLRENPREINRRFLERFESFREFWRISTERHRAESTGEAATTELSATPEEIIDAAHEQLRAQLSADLLAKVKESSPYFFEKIVLRLLQAMGYGGVSGSGMVTPASRDGGIDGLIYEDKLGLDTVCIQAKRWENTVGRRTVQEFVGSMDLHRSKKGVILTTSQFSGDALNYVDRIEGKKVVLIDGAKLCDLMIEHRVGLTAKRNYEILDISEDFFDEEA
jgi:restriction system protein